LKGKISPNDHAIQLLLGVSAIMFLRFTRQIKKLKAYLIFFVLTANFTTPVKI